MGRMTENPRYKVISMRITDAEHETLAQLMASTNKSISEIMREGIDLLITRGAELPHPPADVADGMNVSTI